MNRNYSRCHWKIMELMENMCRLKRFHKSFSCNLLKKTTPAAKFYAKFTCCFFMVKW